MAFIMRKRSCRVIVPYYSIRLQFESEYTHHKLKQPELPSRLLIITTFPDSYNLKVKPLSHTILPIFFMLYPIQISAMLPKVQSTTELRDLNRTQNSFPLPFPNFTPRGTKECRICLSAHSSSRDKLISPCECTGSMRFVHEGCLSEWLQVKVLRQEGIRQGGTEEVQCELCKTGIDVQLELSRQCNSCQETKKQIGKRWILFTIGVLGLIFSVSLMVYSAIQLHMQIRKGYFNASVVERIVVIISLVLNLVLILFFGFTVSGYLLQRKARVKLASK